MQAYSMILSGGGVEVLTPEGEILQQGYDEAKTYLEGLNKTRLTLPPVLVHAPSLFAKLGMNKKKNKIKYTELLELFAFVCPAKFCVPTVLGLQRALGLEGNVSVSSVPLLVSSLLEKLSALEKSSAECKKFEVFWSLAHAMRDAGWSWGDDVLLALQANPLSSETDLRKNPYAVWELLPEWEEGPPPLPPSDDPVSKKESDDRLNILLSDLAEEGKKLEEREEQRNYCAEVTRAFIPKQHEKVPNMVLAEGGTGIGKTYGYLSPSSVWSEKNESSVWVSTYTRNLQHQIMGAVRNYYATPDHEELPQRVVIRKGRRNYLCLLKFSHFSDTDNLYDLISVPLGLMALWILHSEDGDLNGDNFPSWLKDICGWEHTSGLADKRGECIHKACPHYQTCFIEHSVRKARRADVVVANHALVIKNLHQRKRRAEALQSDSKMPLRYVFDEGHRLFDSADSAFASELSCEAMAYLWRWLVGGTSDVIWGRKKGISARLRDLVKDIKVQKTPDNEEKKGAADNKKLVSKEQIAEILDKAEEAMVNADCLPAISDRQEIKMLFKKKNRLPVENMSAGEAFLCAVYDIVKTRAPENGYQNYYGSEYWPPLRDSGSSDDLTENLAVATNNLRNALEALLLSLKSLYDALRKTLLNSDLSNSNDELKNRIDNAIVSLLSVAIEPTGEWIGMLEWLGRRLNNKSTEPVRKYDEVFFHWLAIEREQGKETDVSYHRHYIDPMKPFSDVVLKTAHGCVVTSATLTDDATTEEGWNRAYRRCGAYHLQKNIDEDESIDEEAKKSITHHRFVSSFDYANQARVIVVNDVDVFSVEETASALEALFKASGGGGLGLFTAIKKLRETHALLLPKLLKNDIPLYAQHVDAYSHPDLVGIFEEEEKSCLLGTDALRDGVDITGNSLRLVVFDRIPWHRRSLLFKARVKEFGDEYEHMHARSALRQAFGRLIRSGDDKGVFVILSKIPRSLEKAFPEGADVQRLSLGEALHVTKHFLKGDESCQTTTS